MVYSVDEIREWRRQAIEKRPKTIIRKPTPTEKMANFYPERQVLLVPRDESQYCPYTGACVGDDGPTKGFEWDSD